LVYTLGESAAKPARNGWKVQRLPLVTFLPLFTLGAVAGDGCLGIPSGRPNSVYFSLTHSASQREYLVYKINRINQELGTKGTVSQPRAVYDSRTNKYYWSCQSMVVNPKLKKLYSLFYINGEKQFTSRVLNLLGLEALAIFWMDDGNVGKTTSAVNKGILNLYRPLNEALLVCDWIEDLTNVQAKPYRDGDLYRVRISRSLMPKFLAKIRPFVHTSMKKKVTLYFSHYNTKSKQEYEASLTIPLVNEGDKAA
jgi:hypothetical protein